MYRRVLLAYDGSASGRSALLECCDINNLLHAEIHLLAVAPLMAGLYITEGFVPDTLQEEENRHFKQVLEICRLAAGLSCDLIGVGHRRHQSLLSRWWKGSVGASLIEEAPCSVLITIAK
jgi:nucleotide-binding universal stress UspA family protein